MGLLDDAIREHLDLKRRRGADPSEVQRAEHEALGPVRRNRDPAAAEPGEEPLMDAPYDETAAEPAPGGVAYDHAEQDDWSFDASATQADLPPLELSDHERGHAPRAQPAPDDLHDDGIFDEDEDEDQDDDAFDATAFEASEPAAPAGEVTPVPPPRFVHDTTGHETAEYDVEEALAADDEPGDDMLEETPEFLQDTPDHDRLWFEQRPPKDFDFDS
jgi:hypothetical protein